MTFKHFEKENTAGERGTEEEKNGETSRRKKQLEERHNGITQWDRPEQHSVFHCWGPGHVKKSHRRKHRKMLQHTSQWAGRRTRTSALSSFAHPDLVLLFPYFYSLTHSQLCVILLESSQIVRCNRQQTSNEFAG